MIERPGAAELPEICREDDSLHRVAMGPPAVPEISHVAAGFVAIRGEIGRGQKSGDAEENRFKIVRFFPERRERQSLGEKSEREFVLFVTERGGDLLEQRGVTSVILDDALNARGFALKTKLRRGGEDALEPLLRQIFQGRLAATGSRERDNSGKFIRQHRGIDADLRHVPVRFCAGEKRAVALLDEDVKDRVVKSRVGGMAVRFPTPIREIELDRAADGLAAVDANSGIGKIGTGFAVPSAELDDLDLVAGDGSEAAAEITGEPARLELKFARGAERGEKRAFVDAGGITKRRITAGKLHWGEGGSVGDSWRVDEKKSLEGRPKHQTSSSKHQRNSKHQSTKSDVAGLIIGTGSFSGAWDLELVH